MEIIDLGTWISDPAGFSIVFLQGFGAGFLLATFSAAIRAAVRIAVKVFKS